MNLGVFTDAVPRPAYGMDQWLPEPLVDLAPQAANVRLDDRRLRIEMELPDVLQQHGARNHAPRIAHQILQELELLRLHVDSLAGPGDASLQKIELQVGDAQERLDFGRRRSPRESVYACQQLGESKRLEK